MRKATRRLGRLSGLIAVGIAMIGTGIGVTAGSYSTFGASTSTPASNWTAGAVTLTNNAGSALFTVTGLVPGSTASKCVTVTSTASAAGTVRFYSTSYSGTNTASDLGTYLNLQVDAGSMTGGDCSTFVASTSVYSGTLAAFGTGSTGFSTGRSTGWTTTSGTDTKVFRIGYTLPASVGNEAENLTTGDTFTWEEQTN